MLPRWAYSEAKSQATTSSLLFNGREPRVDVLEKLQDIGHLLKRQSLSYPNFKQKQLLGLFKVVLGNIDERTKKKYFDCVKSYSKKDKIKGEYDVCGFCNTVGV